MQALQLTFGQLHALLKCPLRQTESIACIGKAKYWEDHQLFGEVFITISWIQIVTPCCAKRYKNCHHTWKNLTHACRWKYVELSYLDGKKQLVWKRSRSITTFPFVAKWATLYPAVPETTQMHRRELTKLSQNLVCAKRIFSRRPLHRPSNTMKSSALHVKNMTLKRSCLVS